MKKTPQRALPANVQRRVKQFVFEGIMKNCTKKRIMDVVSQRIDEVDDSNSELVKSFVQDDLSTVKGHLRKLLKEELAAGNHLQFSKSESYVKSHTGIDGLDDDTREFIKIAAYAIAKFENAKITEFTANEKKNKEHIEASVDNYWEYTSVKYENFQENTSSVSTKLSNIMLDKGFQGMKRNTQFR